MKAAHNLSVLLDFCRAHPSELSPDLLQACFLAARFLLYPRIDDRTSRLYTLFSWVACEGPLHFLDWLLFEKRVVRNTPSMEEVAINPWELSPLLVWSETKGILTDWVITPLGLHSARELWGSPTHWRPQFVREPEGLPELPDGYIWVSPLFLFRAQTQATEGLAALVRPITANSVFALSLATGDVCEVEGDNLVPAYYHAQTHRCPTQALSSLLAWRNQLPSQVAAL